jgi:hypothetical protein
LALAVEKGWKVYQMDAVAAFPAFAKETVAQFFCDDSMRHATPMEPGAIRKLVEEPPRPLSQEEWLKYLELLGKLIWLCNMRFDIIFAVNRMAYFTIEAC